MAEPTTFDPTSKSALYDKYAPGWQLAIDFFEMAEHVLRDGTYLDRFGEGSDKAESASQFEWRKIASFAMDICSELVGIRVGNIFRTNPVRSFENSPYATQIKGFLSDVDGGGTSMNTFMKRTLVKYYVNGVDIVVDKTGLLFEPQNLKEEEEAGARPYLMALGPLQRLDWACDYSGKYKWVRYDLGEKPREAEESEAGSHQYLTLSESSWTLYTSSVDNEETSVVEVHGPIAGGNVPVIPFYWSESIKADAVKVPIPLLDRPAPIARAMLNLVSQGQLDILMSIGMIAVFGVKADQLPTEVGPMCFLGFDEGSTLQHVTPDVSHIEEKRNWLGMMGTQILRLGKLTGVTGELMGRASSGLQVAIERTDLDNEMAATAGQAEQVEEDIMRLMVSRSVGKEVTAEELGYSVEYNKKYILVGVNSLLEEAKLFTELGVNKKVPELMRVMLDRFKSAVIRPSDEKNKLIDKEIAAADFEGEFDVPGLGEIADGQPDDLSVEDA